MVKKRKTGMKKFWVICSVFSALIICLVFGYYILTANLTYTSPYTNIVYNIPAQVEALGIDVSQHQGTINWQKVKADGVEFAFIRVAHRGTTAGAIAADARFATNIEGAQAAGIKVGVYVFSQAITESEAQEEAEFALNLVAGYDLDLPVVMDYEFAEGQSSRLAQATLTKAERTAIVLAFCVDVSDQGYVPMVYTNADMLENYLNAEEISANAGMWYAYYNDTSLTTDYAIWQYAESGAVDGISGNVDCDFSFVDLDRLSASGE